MTLFRRISWWPLWGLLALWPSSAFTQSELFSPVVPDSQISTVQDNGDSDEASTLQTLKDLIGTSQAQQEFLDPDVAYSIDVQANHPDRLVARFTIEDGYYLYRDKTGFDSRTEAIVLVEPVMPKGTKKNDPYFGEQIVYYDSFQVELPLLRMKDGVEEAAIEVSYQGCAEGGICYPPMKKSFNVNIAGTTSVQDNLIVTPTTDPSVPAISDGAGPALYGQMLWPVMLAFAAGLALTFTPCVLPMIPILASIVVGQGNNRSKLHGGILSIAYVFGTATTYTAVGVTAGATGEQLQAYFQNPWGIGVIVVILVLMSLSMFGLYDIQLPASLQSRLQTQSGRLQGGALGSVFALGAISALIVGACVSPVLIAVLGLAIERADPVLGGMIMFSMALGSGVILIGLGFGASYLLPKAGPWTATVNYVFGVMLLGVAIYMLSALPDLPILYLWAILLISVSVYLGALEALPEGTNGWLYLRKGVGVLALIWGILALLGGMNDNRDITRPLDLSGNGLLASTDFRSNQNMAETHIVFTRVSDVRELDEQLSIARIAGRPVMLDYYADWCIDCIRMEKSTFSDQAVVVELSDYVMLQADVTDPRNPATNAIKKRYGVYGPPAMLFFDASGSERRELRRYGYMGSEEFLTHVSKI